MRNLLGVLVVIWFFQSAWTFTEPEFYGDPHRFGHGIQKTMQKLEAGDSDSIRILFFGQSIITQSKWYRKVTEGLREMYPQAKIGGYDRSKSGRTTSKMVEQERVADLIGPPLNPDLIIICIYGNEAGFDTLMQEIKALQPNAELLITGDHIRTHKIAFENYMTWEFEAEYLWSRYNLNLIDIRTPWITYMNEVFDGVDSLTKDGTHLNKAGEYLMTQLVLKYFKYRDKEPPPNPVQVKAMSPATFQLSFSEPIEQISGTNPENYRINGTPVRAVDIAFSRRIVTLYTNEALNPGDYEVQIKNIADYDSVGTVMPSAVTLSLSVPQFPEWQSLDIGSTGPGGGTFMADEMLHVFGSGDQVLGAGCWWKNECTPEIKLPYWWWRDSYQYTFQQYQGDVSITAQLNGFTDPERTKTKDMAQAGIMVRANTMVRSAFFSMDISHGGQLNTRVRAVAGDTITTLVRQADIFMPSWLKIEARGNTLIAYSGSDTLTWVEQARVNLDLGYDKTAGVMVCSNTEFQELDTLQVGHLKVVSDTGTSTVLIGSFPEQNTSVKQNLLPTKNSTYTLGGRKVPASERRNSTIIVPDLLP